MAIASPTAARLTRAAMTAPGQFLHRVLYAPTNIRTLAANLADGSPSLEFIHYRIPRDQYREQPGTISMRHTPLAPASRSFLRVESVKATADLFRHEVAVDKAQAAFEGPLGLQSARIASEQLSQAALNESEARMATDLLTDANFGFVGTPGTYGLWDDPSVDPMDAVRAAWQSIMDLGGGPVEGGKVVMAFSQADLNAWMKNPYIRDYRGVSGGVVSTTMLAEILRGELLNGLPESIRASFDLRVHSAARVAGNQGQAEKSVSPTAPTRFITARTQLVVVGPENDIESRSWGKWNEAAEPTVETYEDEEIYANIYRILYASKPTVYDAALGATFNGMVS